MSCSDAPLPEAETAGREARLLGGCSRVLVGLAETRLRAARAETSPKVFIVTRMEKCVWFGEWSTRRGANVEKNGIPRE